MIQNKNSVNGCMDEQNMVHMHTMKYFSIFKKKEILPLAPTWMKLKGIMMLSKISLAQKDKYNIISPNMWNLTKLKP